MNENNAAQPVLTDDEIRTIITDAHQSHGAFKTGYGLSLGRAIESALLSKLRAPVALPAGYALVPIEPTPEMIEAGATERITLHASAGHGAVAGYKAMLAAAPVASAPVAGERAAFEAWMASQSLGFLRDGDSYSLTYARRAWDAWQARAALARTAVASAEVMDALNWVDDFIARCNRDDRGSCESVNVLRRALASAPVADDAIIQVGELHLPTWVVRYANDICEYMEMEHPGHWELSGLMRRTSAPVAGEAQKPVAWMLVGRLKNSEPKFTLADPSGIYESVYVPLYAAPQASEAVRDAGIAASGAEPRDNSGCPSNSPGSEKQAADVVLPPLPEALALQPGQLGHTNQTLDYFARAAVLADRKNRAALSAQPGAQRTGGSDAK